MVMSVAISLQVFPSHSHLFSGILRVAGTVVVGYGNCFPVGPFRSVES